MYYLLGWSPEVNTQDYAGQTSLHLAIKHSEKFSDMRSIKELLLKGADRNLTDKKGNRPVDLISANVRN